jgi:hypothetical protein
VYCTWTATVYSLHTAQAHRRFSVQFLRSPSSSSPRAMPKLEHPLPEPFTAPPSAPGSPPPVSFGAIGPMSVVIRRRRPRRRPRLQAQAVRPRVDARAHARWRCRRTFDDCFELGHAARGDWHREQGSVARVLRRVRAAQNAPVAKPDYSEAKIVLAMVRAYF